MRGTSPKSGRRGAVIVAVMVCLLALAMIGAASLRVGLEERRVLGDVERRLQAEWLMRSGLGRAVSRLAEEDGYPGETWEIPADVLGGKAPAIVRIVVAKQEGEGRRVSVQADFPPGAAGRVKRSGQWVVGRGAVPSGEMP